MQHIKNYLNIAYYMGSMDCDLCGRQDALVNAIVEGSPLKVGRNCARYGHVIVLEKHPEIIKEEKKKAARLEMPAEHIADDYGDLIKSSRERLKLTQQELGLKIAERESLIHKLESYYLEPSIELARKLEKFLNISLVYMMDNVQEEKKIVFKDDSMTIGDIINMKNNPLEKR